MTPEHINYLKRIKKNNIFVLSIQIILFFSFIILWEILGSYKIINTFLFSSPSLILKTLINLIKDNNLFIHILYTTSEVLISSIICFVLSLLISIIFYFNNTLKRIFDPFIILFNSLPKISLGPLLIIWFGANIKTIIVMALLINLIVSFNTILNGFLKVDKDNIKLFKIYNANKKDIIFKLIIPSSKKEIISSLKLNVSMSFIGLLPPVGEKIFFNKCYSRY